MPSDRSRTTDVPQYGYTGPAAQQGRVILDRDFNALQGFSAARIAADALNIIGPSGSPDDGFKISLLSSWESMPPFWSPPEASPPVGSPPETPGSQGDFLIAPGRMYLGGELVCWPGEQNGKAIVYSYFDQPDWPLPDQPPNAQMELAWLDVSEQEVSAVEDPDLLEVALGGPDTTQRLKLLSRVKRLGVNASDCATAWDQGLSAWEKEGLEFNPATMELLPAVRLKVGFVQDASGGNPCDPVATGGYLGADNQLLRVRIVNDTSGASLVWGYDNASYLYRIKSVSADGTMLTLANNPPDAFHTPQTGQIVEILTTASVFAQVPDETDPTGTSEILRVAAEATGELHALAQPYGPVTQGDPASYIVLTEALAASIASIASSPLPLFLRVWQAQLKLDTSGAPVTLADPVTSISTGVTVTITVPKGGVLPDGAFWQIAVRPATPQGVYPESLLTAPQPPDGPRRWVCPLAVIDWTAQDGGGGGSVTDCRNIFDNLVELSRRKPGCCTVSISPRDVTAAKSLQSLIDRAAAQAEVVTVCLGAGAYKLSEPLRLDSRHDGITIESCGGPAVISVAANASPERFIDGLVVLNGVDSVTLQRLTLHPDMLALSGKVLELFLERLPETERKRAEALLATLSLSISFGVRAYNATTLTLDGCTVRLIGKPRFTGDLVATAVLLGGDCSGLTVQNCTLGSGFGPSFTPSRKFLTRAAEASAQPGSAPAPATAPAPAAVPAPAPVQDAAVAPGQAVPGVSREAILQAATGQTISGASRTAILQAAASGQTIPAGVAREDFVKAVTAAASAVPEAVTSAAATAPAQPASAPPATKIKTELLTPQIFHENLTALASSRDTVLKSAMDSVFTAGRINSVDEQQPSFIATAGIAAVDASSLGFKLAATGEKGSNATGDTTASSITLDDMVLRDNRFERLTFAAAIEAELNGLRFQDNEMQGGVAGFWFRAFVATFAARVPGLAFTEFELLYTILAIVPPPEDAASNMVQRVAVKENPAVLAEAFVRLRNFSPDAVFFITGNRISAGILDITTQSTTRSFISSVALLMSMIGRDQSLIVSANQISGTSTDTPAALLLVPFQQPCTVTGNVIWNNFGSLETEDLGASLVIHSFGESGTGPISVTGNVLRGPSNLDSNQYGDGVPRGNAALRGGWSSYNADPD